jgi:FAD binding domain/Berberine and berberine like
VLDALDGEVLVSGSPAYDAVRRPHNPAYAGVRPAVVVRCASDADVVAGLELARRRGLPVVARGGGHCFAGRSSTEGVLLDLSPIDSVELLDEVRARVGAGARLGRVYAELHRVGRTLPAGCGETVGIAGLTLGGGLGLLGRRFGLTCDRLVAARVVLADGQIVDCDAGREPELFWALRGAGGGQFGVVTSLTFETVPEPLTARFELRWAPEAAADAVSAWQRWAPHAPDEMTANLSVAAEPGRDLDVVVFGASMLDGSETRRLLVNLCSTADPRRIDIVAGVPYSDLKRTFAHLDPREDDSPRIRSELFTQPLRATTIDALLAALAEPPTDEPRRLTFLALGGAYARVPVDTTAFAHRGARFNLEHAGPASSSWVDRSWHIAHADGSGCVYANFPDPALTDATTAYHAGHLARLRRVKRAYTQRGSLTSRSASNPPPS